jgi:hypothetical protein
MGKGQWEKQWEKGNGKRGQAMGKGDTNGKRGHPTFSLPDLPKLTNGKRGHPTFSLPDLPKLCELT